MQKEQKMITTQQMEALRLYYHLTNLTTAAAKELNTARINLQSEITTSEKIILKGVSEYNADQYELSERKIKNLKECVDIFKNNYDIHSELRSGTAKSILNSFGIKPDGNTGEHQLVMELLEKHFVLPMYTDTTKMEDIKTRREVIIKIK